MASFLEKVKKVIHKADIIIEIVDARFPNDSRNFDLEKLIKKLKKKFMIVMNKADLVPEDFARQAARTLSKEVMTVYLSYLHKKFQHSLDF